MWPDEATRTLINLWSEEAIQVSLDSAKASKDIAKIYQVLLVSIRNNNHIDTLIYINFKLLCIYHMSIA